MAALTVTHALTPDDRAVADALARLLAAEWRRQHAATSEQPEPARDADHREAPAHA